MAVRALRKRRKPGRPALQDRDAEEVKRALVAAARELFVKRGFAEVGIRELSRAAGVTPGMISYYFGGKLGLYEAMLASVFDELLARVTELASRPARSTAPLEGFMRTYTATLTAQPWLPALLVREVVTGDPSLRARFVERFAQRGAVLLPGLISSEMTGGALRPDLDPVLTVLSLVGAMVFPFIVHPVFGKLLGYQLDDAFAEKLASHTARLFLDGARPKVEAR